MNIKGLLGTAVTPQVRPTDKVDRSIKQDSSHERDANGQQAWSDGERRHGPMSDEQLQKALEHLRQLAAVRENKWTVELQVVEEQKKFVLIKDNLGNLIRRISESELWTLPLDEEAPKGNLLKRSA